MDTKAYCVIYLPKKLMWTVLYNAANIHTKIFRNHMNVNYYLVKCWMKNKEYLSKFKIS